MDEDLQHMEEMSVPSNLRLIVMELPYKFQGKWRAAACELQEHRGNRAMLGKNRSLTWVRKKIPNANALQMENV